MRKLARAADTEDGSAAENAFVVEQLIRWAHDPVAFVLEVFGPGYKEKTGEELVIERWQEKLLRAMVPGHEPHGACDGSVAHTKLLAKACMGPGKTAWLAWVGWWRLTLNDVHRGAALSITRDNLDQNLWAEFALWRSRAPILQKAFEISGSKITQRDAASGGEADDEDGNWWLKARSFPKDADPTQHAATMAGLHSLAVTVLLDETGAMPVGVLKAARGIFNTKGQDAMLAIAGNCNEIGALLYVACTMEADEFFIVEITGDPDDPDHSTRVDIEQAKRDIARYGRSDPDVMVKWLGQFPEKGSNKLLGINDVTAAMKRDCPRHIYERKPMVWGLDVAGEGVDPDSAKLYKRRGPVCFKPRGWRNIKTLKLAEQVALAYKEALEQHKAPKRIFVDKGGVGRGCYEWLQEHLPKGVVVGIDFGESAIAEDKYTNRRTEMYFNVAEWVRSEGCLPDVPELRRDLTEPATGTESRTRHGTRRTLETKKEMKDRGLPSPDDGDGLALTFAQPVLSDEPEDTLPINYTVPDEQFDGFAHMGGRAQHR